MQLPCQWRAVIAIADCRIAMTIPPPERAMETRIIKQDGSITFPHGFFDFLQVSQGRRHKLGDYELEPERLERFNQALRMLSPEAPSMTMDQIATAGARSLARHPDGGTPSFVQSRMESLARLELMAADEGWGVEPQTRGRIDILLDYRRDRGDLIPDEVPVIGLLDDALLVDVALQLLRGELADYEDFCRFRKVAAEFSGMQVEETGLTRHHWLEAMWQAQASASRVALQATERYVPDTRASLFHIT
jgi:hypothetical protein